MRYCTEDTGAIEVIFVIIDASPEKYNSLEECVDQYLGTTEQDDLNHQCVGCQFHRYADNPKRSFCVCNSPCSRDDSIQDLYQKRD